VRLGIWRETGEGTQRTPHLALANSNKRPLRLAAVRQPAAGATRRVPRNGDPFVAAVACPIGPIRRQPPCPR
jgi:hypothetical protein